VSPSSAVAIRTTSEQLELEGVSRGGSRRELARLLGCVQRRFTVVASERGLGDDQPERGARLRADAELELFLGEARGRLAVTERSGEL
jgi:hypothetical protein